MIYFRFTVSNLILVKKLLRTFEY